MIRLCIFDMGGVLVRNHNVCPSLSEYLGYPGVNAFKEYGQSVFEALNAHSCGKIDEKAFWKVFSEETGKNIEMGEESLLGRFFDPVIDTPTERLLEDLKEKGMRIVCGTNVIPSHYSIHISRKQYNVFDKVYASFEMNIDKPNPEFFRYILDSESCNAEDCFFTDDLIGNVEAAKNTGIHAYIYKNATVLKQSLEKEGIM